jgi:hypothetical protein
MALWDMGESQLGGRKQVVESGAACSEHEFTRANVPVCEELWRCDEPERNVENCIFGVQIAGNWQYVIHFRHVWSTGCVSFLWIRRTELWRYSSSRFVNFYGLWLCIA